MYTISIAVNVCNRKTPSTIVFCEMKELEQRTTEQVTRQLEEMKAMELKKMERQVSK